MTASATRLTTSSMYSGSASDPKQLATGPPPCVWLAPIRTCVPGILVVAVIAVAGRGRGFLADKQESIPTRAIVPRHSG